DDRPIQRSGRSPLSFLVSSSSAFFRSNFWQAAVTSVVSCLTSHLSFSFGPWSKAETGAPASCQSALNWAPRSACKRDPFERRVLAVALAPSELAGVAETARARAGT